MLKMNRIKMLSYRNFNNSIINTTQAFILLLLSEFFHLFDSFFCIVLQFITLCYQQLLLQRQQTVQVQTTQQCDAKQPTAAAAAAWNSLSSLISTSTSMAAFGRKFKTFLFQSDFHRHCTSKLSCHRN